MTKLVDEFERKWLLGPRCPNPQGPGKHPCAVCWYCLTAKERGL